MFTKLFSSIVHSSIWLEDLETKVLWITMLALMDRQGCVYASAGGLARTAGLTPEATRKILEKFQSPDPDSADLTREPEREGRRIEEIDGGWRLFNAKHYRAIRDAEERREQNRQAQSRSRQRKSAVSSDGQQKSASDQIRSDQRQKTGERGRFAPPTPAEVQEYAREIGLVRVDAFYDFYASKGWKVGNAPMKDWRAAARRWQRTDVEDGRVATKPATDPATRARADRDAEAQAAAVRELEEDRKARRAAGLE